MGPQCHPQPVRDDMRARRRLIGGPAGTGGEGIRGRTDERKEAVTYLTDKDVTKCLAGAKA